MPIVRLKEKENPINLRNLWGSILQEIPALRRGADSELLASCSLFQWPLAPLPSSHAMLLMITKGCPEQAISVQP